MTVGNNNTTVVLRASTANHASASYAVAGPAAACDFAWVSILAKYYYLETGILKVMGKYKLSHKKYLRCLLFK